MFLLVTRQSSYKSLILFVRGRIFFFSFVQKLNSMRFFFKVSNGLAANVRLSSPGFFAFLSKNIVLWVNFKFESLISLTCSVDVKVGGFVGDVAHRFDSWTFDRDFGGVAERLVHIHLERTFGNWLTGKQHRHLGNKNNKYSEAFI